MIAILFTRPALRGMAGSFHGAVCATASTGGLSFFSVIYDFDNIKNYNSGYKHADQNRSDISRKPCHHGVPSFFVSICIIVSCV